MIPPLPSAPPKTPPPRGQTITPLSTPLSAGMGSVAEYGNDWGRMEIVKWLVDDVARTQDAPAWNMLHAFTKRIVPMGSEEKPADVFERILKQVEPVRSIAMSEARKAKKKKPEETKTKRRGGRHRRTPDEQTTHGRTRRQRQNQPRGTHQTATAGPSSGDSTQAAQEPTIAEKGAAMVQAYNTFLGASSESTTYPPFITMTNLALDLLKNEVVEGTIARNAEYDILLQHNDPNLLVNKVNGNVYKRKPDNIFVTLETAKKLHGEEKASWSYITAKYATKSRTQHGKHHAILDWGDALCSVEHKRTSSSITRPTRQRLNENTVLPSLHDLDRLRLSPTKISGKLPIDDLSEVNETTSGSKRMKTSQGSTRMTTTGPSHADSEDSRAYIEGPAPEADLLSSVAIQSAEHGLGRLCCSYDISHAFTLIVVDGVLHISWYDHEGIITTDGLNLAKYFDYYLALLFILQRFDRSAWGRLEDQSLRSDRNGTHDETMISVEGKEFAFNMKVDENILRKPFAIGGRATSLYRSRMEDDQAPGHVVKFNWKESTRKSEHFILQEIRKRIHNHELDLSPETGEVLDETDDLHSYLPEVVAGVETQISTKTIREDLGITSHSRELVVIVFVMLDGTIKELKGEEYWQVFWDCLRCHKRLFKLGIYHCDVSDGNLMFIRKNGHALGRLIDFDLAIISDTLSGNHCRTGTRPFMAIELLNSKTPIKRHYKHDAESFFWVVVYDTTSSKSVNGWGRLTNTMLSATKCNYLLMGTEALPMREKHPPILSWVEGVRGFLIREMLNRQFSPIATREKDWGIDELYNTLRGFRHDQGTTLDAYIKTRQEKCKAPTAS